MAYTAVVFVLENIAQLVSIDFIGKKNEVVLDFLFWTERFHLLNYYGVFYCCSYGYRHSIQERLYAFKEHSELPGLYKQVYHVPKHDDHCRKGGTVGQTEYCAKDDEDNVPTVRKFELK